MLIDGWAVGRHTLTGMIAALSVAVFYGVRQAFVHLHTHSAGVRSAAARAERHYIDVLRRIVTIVESRDAHWSGHSERVGDLAARLARQMGMDAESCELLGLAGELHDIGLLAVPEAVLHKHGTFGSEDFGCVRKHSEASFEVLRALESLTDVLSAVRHHHERMNGTGYPQGLAGKSIPLGARILAVADAYDAMTHDRPHRAALAPYQAMRELQRCTPEGFDPDCVEALAETVNLPGLTEVMSVAAG